MVKLLGNTVGHRHTNTEKDSICAAWNASLPVFVADVKRHVRSRGGGRIYLGDQTS